MMSRSVSVFKKKEIIFSERQGVCLVDNIEKLVSQKGVMPIEYYVLEPIADKSRKAYFPVENHEVLLRSLISKEEAIQKKQLKELSLIEIQEIEYVLNQI